MTDDGGTEVTGPGPVRPSLRRGMQVEVRNGLDGTWEPGFTVEEVTGTGYRLRRESDGAVLPELHHERVRRRKTRATWWI